MIFGNFVTYELTIAGSNVSNLDLSKVVTTEKEIRIHSAAAGVRVIFTPITSTTDASATSYLLSGDEHEFELGKGLDRISFYNGSGGEVKVSVAVMF